MSEYRLYLLEEDRIVAFRDIVADDDSRALTKAVKAAAGRPAELWCGARRIGFLPAEDQTNAA